MARTTTNTPLLPILSLLLLTVPLLPVAARGNNDEGSSIGWILGHSGGVFDIKDFDMSSESTRRILASTQYISYGALKANNVPCSQRGASYYNCNPGAPSNPYTRGCSAITRCRS